MKKLLRVSTIPSSLAVFCRRQLKLLSLSYDLTAVSSPGDELRLLESDGIKVEAVEMKRNISPLSDIVSLWKMWRLMVRLRPDAVHSITPKAGLISMLAARLAGVPVRIHTFTGLVWPTSRGLKRHLLIAMDRLLCACATEVIPEGKGVLNDLSRMRITSKPMTVLGYGNIRGIDCDYYDPDLQFDTPDGFEQGTFNFIFIGRIVNDKGIRELVEAFSEISAVRPGTRLWLVGRREEELDPLPAATSSLIRDNCQIIEVGEVSDVRPWLAASQCLVLPSYREGFPNSVIEAGAMGLPSIVTDINGSNEIIIDRVNGLIVPPRDAVSLQKAMETLLDDDTIRNKMEQTAREMIMSSFDQDIVYDALADLYKRII